MSTYRPRATRRGSRMDWVKFDFELARDGSVDPTDKALYAAIASFVDVETRESPDAGDVDLNGIPEDVPTRKRLAQCIGRSPDTVDRATKRLENRRLLKVHRQADPDNPKLNLPSEYELLDHELWDERAAARSARRAERRQAAEGKVPDEGGSRTDAATPGRAHAATPGRTDAAVKDLREVEEEKGEGEEAVSPRSGGDGRRPSSGSKSLGSVENSGFAASGKTSSHSPQHDDTPRPARSQKDGSNKEGRKYTAAEWVQINAVRALLPPEIRDGLPYAPSLSEKILTAMAEGRTAEQLGERIWYRWSNHGFADQLAELGVFETLVGVAVALVRPLRRGDRFACPDLRCENGADIDTKVPCRLCPERIADWKAEQARQYGQKRPVAPNSAPVAPGSPDTVLPPQRAVPRGAPERSGCPGRDGSCVAGLAPGQTLCWSCADEDAEQSRLETAGSHPPF